MILRHDDLASLGRLRPEKHLVTTCYLNTNGKEQTERDYRTLLKGALRRAQEDLDRGDLPDDVRQAAEKDLERIRAWVEGEFDRKGTRGLAIVACGPEEVWNVFPLNHPVATRIVQDRSPYLRPLSMLLDEHPRICVVLVDREKARILEISLGEVSEVKEVQDEVPDQVRAGGWKGYDEKRISRHIEDHVHRHYRRTADALFEVFRRQGFDWLVVGGHRSALGEFKAHLHSYLQEKLKATFEADLNDSVSEVLERVQRIERDLEASEEAELLQRLRTEALKGGLGVLGVEPVLEALQRGAVHTLVVDNGAQASGSRCSECRRLTLQPETCPSCGGESLSPIPHLLDEALEDAMLQGAEVEHILHHDEHLEEGPLAALLRFRYMA